MADMGEYAERIREIIEEAQNDMLSFDIVIIGTLAQNTLNFIIRDGMDREVIW